MSEPEIGRVIDPDPFTIVSTFMATAAVVLQLVQIYQAGYLSTTTQKSRSANQERMLSELENQVETLSQISDRVLRTIDRGSSNPDTEFYSAPFRLGLSLNLRIEAHDQLRRDLAQLYTTLGSTSLWVNHIIAEDSALASRLGSHLQMNLPEFAAHLNRILEQGLSNRLVIEEGKAALRALRSAIETELGYRN